MELILVRHGETSWNRERRVQGITDLDLNEEGVRQARLLAASLKGQPIEAIYTSPLKRARQTAEIINIYHGVPIHEDRRLREMDQGVFEGLSYPELMRCERDFLRRWMTDPAAVRMPGGESLTELQGRAWPATAEIVAQGVNALMVSHNFTLAAILCFILDINLSEFRRVSMDTASRTMVRFQEGRGRVVYLNDRSHLEERG